MTRARGSASLLESLCRSSVSQRLTAHQEGEAQQFALAGKYPRENSVDVSQISLQRKHPVDFRRA